MLRNRQDIHACNSSIRGRPADQDLTSQSTYNQKPSQNKFPPPDLCQTLSQGNSRGKATDKTPMASTCKYRHSYPHPPMMPPPTFSLKQGGGERPTLISLSSSVYPKLVELSKSIKKLGVVIHIYSPRRQESRSHSYVIKFEVSLSFLKPDSKRKRNTGQWSVKGKLALPGKGTCHQVWQPLGLTW